MSSSSEEKNVEASDHKLTEARRLGDVATSKDLTGAFEFAAVLLLVWMGADLAEQQLRLLFDAAFESTVLHGQDRNPADTAVKMLTAALFLVVPLLLVSVVASVLVGLVQTRGVFSLKRIEFDFSRLDPAESFKHIFSTQQLGVLIQMLLKLCLLVGILVWTFRSFIGPMIDAVHADGESQVRVSIAVFGALFGGAAAAFLLVGLIDYVHQYHEYLKRNRMSVSEQEREAKELEGSPEMKTLRATRRQELLAEATKGGVNGASVVVTNPTHFAVALYYEPGVVDLPVLVAKGHDATALSIRSEARRLGVPIMENPPLARALYRGVALGEYIGDEHVEAVAEVFRWLKSLKTAAHPVRGE
jgi:flagellar biosynthesis protein FlhB